MSTRLGETLVRCGALTEHQLKKALEAQLIYGAHLGTCLIELGYVQEQQLGGILARIFGVEYARGELLENIPEDVLGTLPQRIVGKYKVIPFDLDNGLLHVAMVNPKDLHALDEIRFASGKRVEAWVSPEIRILAAMERFYAIPRPQRYIGLYRQSGETSGQMVETASGGMINETSSSVRSSGPDFAVPGLQGVKTPEESLALLSDRYCQAESEERLVSLTLDELRRTMPRCLFLAVRETEASIRDARGFDGHNGRLSRIVFSVTKERLFSLLLDKGHYKGPLPEETRYLSFYKKLQSERPEQILLWPVYCHGRLVGIFYGDSGEGGTIEARTAYYETLVGKLSLALGLILLKRKIRSQ